LFNKNKLKNLFLKFNSFLSPKKMLNKKQRKKYAAMKVYLACRYFASRLGKIFLIIL